MLLLVSSSSSTSSNGVPIWGTVAAAVGASVVTAIALIVQGWLTAGREDKRASARLTHEREMWQRGRSADHEAWARDRRSDIYTRVLRLHADMLSTLREFGNGQIPQSSIGEKARTQARSLVDLSAELEIWGSIAAYDKALALSEQLAELAGRPELDRTMLDPAWEQFVRQCKVDLELKD